MVAYPQSNAKTTIKDVNGCFRQAKDSCRGSGCRKLRQSDQMNAAAAEQSQQTDNDQIDRDDIVQQSRHHKDQNASDQ